MSFDWRSYHELAYTLIECGSDAAFRSSISRSYYAIYNQLCIRIGYTGNRRKPNHTKFANQFKELSDKIVDNLPSISDDDLIFIGNELDNLRKGRNKADYNGTEKVNKKDATYAYDRVKDLLELLSQEV